MIYSIFALVSCVADPSWLFSLLALHSASGLHRSTDNLVVIVFTCVCLILTPLQEPTLSSGFCPLPWLATQ